MGRLTQILTKIAHEAEGDEDINTMLLDALEDLKFQYSGSDYKALKKYIQGATFQREPKDPKAAVEQIAGVLKIKKLPGEDDADEAASDDDDEGLDAHEESMDDIATGAYQVALDHIRDMLKESDIPEDLQKDAELEIMNKLTNLMA